MGCIFKQEPRDFCRKLDEEGITHVAWIRERTALGDPLGRLSSKNLPKASLRDREEQWLNNISERCPHNPPPVSTSP